MTNDPFSKIAGVIGSGVRDFFLRGAPDGQKPVTAEEIKRAYQYHSPIAGYLPWLDIVDDNKLLLEDGRSVAAVFELQSVPTEARSKDFLAQQRNQIRDFITLSFEEHSHSPWVVSTYAWLDSAAFTSLTDAIRAHAFNVHAQRDAIPDAYSHHFLTTSWSRTLTIWRERVACFWIRCGMIAPGGEASVNATWCFIVDNPEPVRVGRE